MKTCMTLWGNLYLGVLSGSDEREIDFEFVVYALSSHRLVIEAKKVVTHVKSPLELAC